MRRPAFCSRSPCCPTRCGVASIAGVASPLFFGAVYAFTLAPSSPLPYSGLSFLIAALVLLAAAILGWAVARRAEAAERIAPRPAE